VLEIFPMRKVLAVVGGCAVIALGTGCEVLAPVEAPPPYAQGLASTQGQWVWSDQYGWMWVPAEATPLEVQGEPYVYLYTRSYGWTWFDSPWGWYGPAGGWGARAYRFAPRATNIAPPAYRVAPRALNVAPPAHRFVGPGAGFHVGRR
jgi:hypothetical protein